MAYETNLVGTINTILGTGATLGTFVVGYFQYQLRKEIKQNAMVELIPDVEAGVARLVNTGQVNLSLHRVVAKKEDTGEIIYDKKFDRPRLISSSTQTHVWGEIPDQLFVEEEVLIKLFYTGEYGEKWVSEHGTEKFGEGIRFFTYGTKNEDWDKE